MRVKQKVTLTDAFVQRVSPKPQTFLVWDAKQPRLALRVYPSGRKSFWFIYAARGRGPTW
jgi:hypothetical protein